MVNDPAQLAEESKAVGVSVESCGSDGGVQHAGDQTLVDLIVAAHNETLTSTEAVALKDYLGDKSQEWTDYQEARKTLVKQERAVRYKVETDSLILKALENGTKTETAGGTEYQIAVAKSEWDEWLTTKDTIRAELPYPDEGYTMVELIDIKEYMGVQIDRIEVKVDALRDDVNELKDAQRSCAEREEKSWDEAWQRIRDLETHKAHKNGACEAKKASANWIYLWIAVMVGAATALVELLSYLAK
ncbi:hypothetical protein ACFL2Q_14325 [Thermodesulfobacteriota bacterium]